MIKCSILAATNTQVDMWNKRVQLLNTNETHDLLSTDKLSQVDDPSAYLQDIIQDDVLHEYVVNGVPPHCLQLKPGDICLVMRNLSKRFGLATNSRVLILSISKYCIRVQTVGPSPKISANIKVFCNDKSIWEDAPLLSNIVYPELLPD
jgi:hypothetical protein